MPLKSLFQALPQVNWIVNFVWDSWEQATYDVHKADFFFYNNGRCYTNGWHTWINSSLYECLGISDLFHSLSQFTLCCLCCLGRGLHYGIVGMVDSVRKNEQKKNTVNNFESQILNAGVHAHEKFQPIFSGNQCSFNFWPMTMFAQLKLRVRNFSTKFCSGQI